MAHAFHVGASVYYCIADYCAKTTVPDFLFFGKPIPAIQSVDDKPMDFVDRYSTLAYCNFSVH